MHLYFLSDQQIAVVECVERLARVVLTDLGIPFTSGYLRERAATAYLRTTGRVVLSEDGRTEGISWEDPTNVALVLAETLKGYHVKHEVADEPITEPGASTLVILQPEDSEGYASHLGVVRSSGSVEWPAAEGRLPSARDPETFVVLTRNHYSGEPDHADNVRKERLRRTATVLLPAVALGVAAAAVVEGARTTPLLLWVPLSLIWVTGMYLSFLLVVLEKTGTYANALIAKVCGAKSGKPTCQSVISSAGSKLFGMSLSDLGGVYFVTLACTAAPALLMNQYTRFYGMFLAAAVIPVPFSLYLLYQQAFVLRRFCALCVGVHGLLLLQLGCFIAFRTRSPAVLDIQAVAVTAGVALAVVTGFYLGMQMWSVRSRMWLLAAERERTHGDPANFEAAAQRQPEYHLDEVPGSILLGTPRAPLHLTAVLSPTCGPCASMLSELMRIADWLGDELAVEIRLSSDPITRGLAEEVLRWSLAGLHGKALEFLGFWYAAFADESTQGLERVDLARVLERARTQAGPAPEEDGVGELVDRHQHALRHVSETPLLIFRGKRVPQRYLTGVELVTVLEQQGTAAVA